MYVVNVCSKLTTEGISFRIAHVRKKVIFLFPDIHSESERNDLEIT